MGMEREDEDFLAQLESTIAKNQACGCAEVSDYIFELIDAQMPKEQVARMYAHLASCPHCSQIAEAEHHVREIVRRSCCESAPSSLRMKVTAFLSVYREATS